ncbi:MAG: hypothetical protein LWX83_12550 [Anaerolineae bacterium]|nr:hypothetical protein [Anaerolineae bacterium]
MRKSSSNKILIGFKFLFTAGSLALTLILWNLFSSQAIAVASKQEDGGLKSSNNQQTQPDAVPTLIPLQFELPESNPAVLPASEVIPTTAPLRKVAVPTSMAPQKPVVHEVTIEQSGGGGGGGGGGGSAPAATTGSSK